MWQAVLCLGTVELTLREEHLAVYRVDEVVLGAHSLVNRVLLAGEQPVEHRHLWHGWHEVFVLVAVENDLILYDVCVEHHV